MPELPEVETVKNTLNQLIGGKRIDHAEVYLPRIIQHPADIWQFCALLQGLKVERVDRRGKFLLFRLGDWVLVSHLRMEGRYGLFREDEPVEKHTHVVFYFTDGTQLRYKDVRQFGTMHLFEEGREQTQAPLKKLGMEPLEPDFTLSALRKKLAGRPTRIKPLLLNQEYIVGLGNIYVDEALYQAGIHPERQANTLRPREWARLYEAIGMILREAVQAGGSSIKSYVNGQGEMGMFQQQLKVYGRGEQPCYQCGQAIVKTVVGGRGTHWCPSCQSIPKAKAGKQA